MARRFAENVDDRKRAAGILALSAKTGRFLLVLRPDCEKFASVGGFASWGEHLSATAIREFHEETMYDGPMFIMKGYHYTNPVKNFEYANYLGIVPEEFIPQLDAENLDFEWVTLSQLYGGMPLHPSFEDFIHEAKSMIEGTFQILDILSE